MKNAFCVIMFVKHKENQRVTKQKTFEKNSFEVGTPEAVCPPFSLPKTLKFTPKQKKVQQNQWVAGFIDGDGCFLLSKKGYASLEITVALKDEIALKYFKDSYGGSLKKRAGSSSLRYRLTSKNELLLLLNDVNGEIRHPIRQQQFQKLCQHFGFNIKFPLPLTSHNAWFAGFFDADGTVHLNLKTASPQISISVTQKQKEIIDFYKGVFGGSVYFDSSQNGYWSWAVQSRNGVLGILQYFKFFPSITSKAQKLRFIPQVYELLSQKAHLQKEGHLLKTWQKLLEKWQ